MYFHGCVCCRGTNYAVERGTANNTILGVENLIDLLTMPLLLLLLKNTYFFGNFYEYTAEACEYVCI